MHVVPTESGSRGKALLVATTLRPRTIQFFEVMAFDDGEQVRMDQQDWPAFLKAMRGADLASRTWQAPDRTIIGQVYGFQGEDRLLLHKLRGPGDWLAEVDFNTEDISEVEMQAERGYLDSTAIQFASFGNIVALMAGSTSAPSHKTLDGFLTHLSPFGANVSLTVRPLVAHAELEKLKQATQVGRVELKLGTTHLAAMKGKQGNLAKWIRQSKKFGDVDVTVIISVPRGKKNNEQRIALARELGELSDAIPSAASAAKATLYYGPEDALSGARITELVEHNITAKRNVPAVGSVRETV